MVDRDFRPHLRGDGRNPPRPLIFAVGAILSLACNLPALAPQDPTPVEPEFYTPFATRFLGTADLVVIASVRTSARIGVTEKVIAEVEVLETLRGKAHKRSFPILADLSHGLVGGDRALFFLDRKPRTRQYWAVGAVSQRERDYVAKLSLIRSYLDVAKTPEKLRFRKLLAVLEARLRGSSSWGRWNAVRELADVALAYHDRIGIEHIQRWESWGGKSKRWKETFSRLRREWRKAREGQ